MYYVLLDSQIDRQAVLDALKNAGVHSVFHYVPLHSSPAGKRYGRVHGAMAVTDRQSERLIRLPLWIGLTTEQQNRVITVLVAALCNSSK
jgi:dTDP-4-amino-4,6-dideoxygalactose transaminase